MTMLLIKARAVPACAHAFATPSTGATLISVPSTVTVTALLISRVKVPLAPLTPNGLTVYCHLYALQG